MQEGWWAYVRAAALRLRWPGFEDLAWNEVEVPTHDRIETVAKETGWTVERAVQKSEFGSRSTFTLKRGRYTIVINLADATGYVSHAYWLREQPHENVHGDQLVERLASQRKDQRLDTVLNWMRRAGR